MTLSDAGAKLQIIYISSGLPLWYPVLKSFGIPKASISSDGHASKSPPFGIKVWPSLVRAGTGITNGHALALEIPKRTQHKL